jgi:hypothetical protein
VVVTINTLFGKLNIPDSRWGYYIFDTRTIDISNTNICEILEHIYYRTKKSFIEIEICKPNYIEGQWDEVFYAKGMLHLHKNKIGIYDWHIGQYKKGVDLGNFLFNHTGNFYRIRIRSYIRRYQKENPNEKNKNNTQ